ncbi:MAG: amidohydrolase [Bacteroidia bacterium]|jgi:predicted amidohydrolase|nr:amidohydrolase [Bacteroidia bacterium]
MQDLSLALLQTHIVWEDAEENHRHFGALLSRLTTRPDLVVLPETFNTGFPVDASRFAQKPDGPSMQWMAGQAKNLGAVVCGSLLLETPEGFQNTFVWMRPDGTFSTYAKRHVFRMGGEHHSIMPGEKLTTVELKGWKIRPMVCYDLRFPVWCRNTYQYGDFDYDLMLFVANWPESRSFPWKQLLIARAIENQACVIGLNRIGEDGIGNTYSGDSCLIDAKGQVLWQAKPHYQEIFEGILEAGPLLDFRRKFQVAADWDAFTLNLARSTDKLT